MNGVLDGNAVVYCEGCFATTNGKTAHGLVRRTTRYKILSVIDSTLAGRDAGEALDGKHRGIPIHRSLSEAVEEARRNGSPPAYMVVGLAPDGGRLRPADRTAVLSALELGLNVDCGLHDFLSEDPTLVRAAETHGATLRDIRKPPHRDDLHFFSGDIEKVEALKIAVLGTDSAVGKRTTAWILADALNAAGVSCQMVGTGQTSWLQGAKYSMVLDSVVSDFVAGEIEHMVVQAWTDAHPEVILIEGQGSIMNPAYPGGFEILAAGRPDAIVLQHAPARLEYDGFPGYPIHAVEKQIQVLELLSDKPVVAITLNHENMNPEAIPEACEALHRRTGLPVFDVLTQGPDGLVSAVQALRKSKAAVEVKA